MYKKNESQADYELRIRFIKYLSVSIEHYRGRYCEQKSLRANREILEDTICVAALAPYEMSVLSHDLQLQLEDESLLFAIRQLSTRERYVLLARAVDERSFKEIAVKLNISYKGTAAIYYRAVAKVKKHMGVMSDFARSF